MGRERTRRGKHLHLCVAVLIAALLAGCAPVQESVSERQRSAHRERIRWLLKEGDFRAAVAENQQVVSQFPTTAPGDAALFNLGLLSADDSHPDTDYAQALGFFERLRRDFPHSPLAPEAKIWAGVLKNHVSEQHQRCVHLQRIRLLLQQGDFQAAVAENQRILSHFPKISPGDAALLSMGMILADETFRDKDYTKAFGFFSRLITEFPHSPLAPEAKIWRGVLKNQTSKKHQRYAHLERIRLLLQQGDFEQARSENKRVFSRFPKTSPGDAALFSMGMIQVHFANPKKDYKKALKLFRRLKNEFPGSPFVDESRTWIAILERMGAAARVDIEIEEKTKRLIK